MLNTLKSALTSIPGGKLNKTIFKEKEDHIILIKMG